MALLMRSVYSQLWSARPEILRAEWKEMVPSLPRRFLIFLVPLMGILTWGTPVVHAQVRAGETEAIEGAFREAVSLWAGERFETLWEGADAATRRSVSREQFVFRMRDRALTPACCFRQVQELTVTFQTLDAALVRAKMGFDSRTRGTTLDATLSFSLRREEGEWRVVASDFLGLPDETLHRLFLSPPRVPPR